MGYNTRYQIDEVVMGGQCDETDGSAFVTVIAKKLFMQATTVQQFNNYEEMKWYGHETDIAAAMKATGATSVTLSGEGEEVGDKWEKKFSREDDDEIWCREYRYELRRPGSPTKEGRVKL